MRVAIFDRMEECTEAEVQRMLPLVSEQRRGQALKYKHTFGQYCCLKSWLMLYEMIQKSGNLDIEFRYNEHGKPFLEQGPFFSISHCKEGIAVAIDDQPIGIDIEGIRKADKDLIERVMNEEEIKLIANANAESARTFTRLWTQKEAIVKAQGVGIYSFEQIQHILSGTPEIRNSGNLELQTIEKENYIYSIAYGKLHCFSA